jgi:hypothetical protein
MTFGWIFILIYLTLCRSMIFSESRFPVFGIMFQDIFSAATQDQTVPATAAAPPDFVVDLSGRCTSILSDFSPGECA